MTRVPELAALPVTPERVAAWMLDELSRRGGLLPEHLAALEIVRLFGGRFCRVRRDGEYMIMRRVRDAFGRLAVSAPREVVWDDGARAWYFGPRPPRPYR